MESDPKLRDVTNHKAVQMTTKHNEIKHIKELVSQYKWQNVTQKKLDTNIPEETSNYDDLKIIRTVQIHQYFTLVHVLSKCIY